MLGRGIETFDTLVDDMYKIVTYESKPPKDVCKAIVILSRKLDQYHDKLVGQKDSKIDTNITDKDINEVIKSNAIYVVLYDSDTIVGYGQIVQQDKHINIDDLYIDDDYRGKGLGRLLLTYIENLTRDKKRSYVVLNVMSYNTVALQVYTRLGYKKFLGGYIILKDPKSSTKIPVELPKSEIPKFKEIYIRNHLKYDLFSYKELENTWNEFRNSNTKKFQSYLVQLDSGYIALLETIHSKYYGTFSYCMCLHHLDKDDTIRSKPLIVDICSQLFKWKNTRNINYVYLDVFNMDTDIADTLPFLRCDGYGLYKLL